MMISEVWYAFHTIAECERRHSRVAIATGVPEIGGVVNLWMWGLRDKLEDPSCYGYKLWHIPFVQWYGMHTMLLRLSGCIPLLISKSQQLEFSQTNNFSRII